MRVVRYMVGETRVEWIDRTQQAETGPWWQPLRITWHGGCGCGGPARKEPTPIYQWLGLRWYGVPWPLRWQLLDDGQQVRLHLHDLPGCGCIIRLKRLATAAQQWLREA